MIAHPEGREMLFLQPHEELTDDEIAEGGWFVSTRGPNGEEMQAVATSANRAGPCRNFAIALRRHRRRALHVLAARSRWRASPEVQE